METSIKPLPPEEELIQRSELLDCWRLEKVLQVSPGKHRRSENPVIQTAAREEGGESRRVGGGGEERKEKHVDNAAFGLFQVTYFIQYELVSSLLEVRTSPSGMAWRESHIHVLRQ